MDYISFLDDNFETSVIWRPEEDGKTFRNENGEISAAIQLDASVRTNKSVNSMHNRCGYRGVFLYNCLIFEGVMRFLSPRALLHYN